MPDWNQILDEFGGVVWQQALRMLGNENDAADCFQKVMLDAFELSQRRPVLCWPGLLKRLATLRSLDMLRERYRHAMDPLPRNDVPAPSRVAAEETLENEDLADHLRRELAVLPHDQAVAFSLRWIEAMSVEEVAERMQITANHVAVLVHRARKTLRRRLSREGK